MWKVLVASLLITSQGIGETADPPESLTIAPKSPTPVTTHLGGDRWRTVLSLEVLAAKPVQSALSLNAPVKIKALGTQLPASAGLHFVRITLEGEGPLPIAAYVEHPSLAQRFRFEIPPPPIPGPPAWSPLDNLTDLVLVAALGLALLAVGGGAYLAGVRLREDMGSQTWTFSSWATNASVGAGLIALLSTLVPEAKSSATLIVAVLGFVSAASPLAYNLTSREEGKERKGKVILFLCSAVLTGAAALGQMLIVMLSLPAADRRVLPEISLHILQVTLGISVAALLCYLVTSVRDTLVAQTRPGERADSVRTRVPGEPFPAL